MPLKVNSYLQTPIMQMTRKHHVFLDSILGAKALGHKEILVIRGLTGQRITEEIVDSMHPGRFDANGNLGQDGRRWLENAVLAFKIEKDIKEVTIKDFVSAYLRTIGYKKFN